MVTMATVLTGLLKILFYLVKLDKENAVQTNGTWKSLFWNFNHLYSIYSVNIKNHLTEFLEIDIQPALGY